MFIRDVREIFSIVVSTLGAGPFLYRVWFRHGNANKIHWANIESIIPFCPKMSKYNSCMYVVHTSSLLRIRNENIYYFSPTYTNIFDLNYLI